MWLAFAVDEDAAAYFVGIISGPRAHSMALWMRNETVEEDYIMLYDVAVTLACLAVFGGVALARGLRARGGTRLQGQGLRHEGRAGASR